MRKTKSHSRKKPSRTRRSKSKKCKYGYKIDRKSGKCKKMNRTEIFKLKYGVPMTRENLRRIKKSM